MNLEHPINLNFPNFFKSHHKTEKSNKIAVRKSFIAECNVREQRDISFFWLVIGFTDKQIYTDTESERTYHHKWMNAWTLCKVMSSHDDVGSMMAKNANSCNILLQVCLLFCYFNIISIIIMKWNEVWGWEDSSNRITECSTGKSNYNFLFLFTSLTWD